MEAGERGSESYFRYKLFGYLIFFFDVVLAFLIITTSWFVGNYALRKAALIFGLAMLALSVGLRIAKQW